MAARGGARLKVQLLSTGIWGYFSNELQRLGTKNGLRLGWLRAATQGYSYSCNKNVLGSNFQKNLTSWVLTLGWGLDGCARWRKVTIAVTIKLNCGVIFKII